MSNPSVLYPLNDQRLVVYEVNKAQLLLSEHLQEISHQTNDDKN